MAIPKEPLPLDMWHDAIRHHPITTTFFDILRDAENNPPHHVVYYNAHTGCVTYITPDTFYLHAFKASSSDCVWYVPNTNNKRKFA